VLIRPLVLSLFVVPVSVVKYFAYVADNPEKIIGQKVKILIAISRAAPVT